jgi:ATP-dependent helicase/nuclease subunit B
LYGGKLRALYAYLEEIGLPERIAEKEAALRTGGEIQLADEYRQLWDIVVRALDQFYAVLGGSAGSHQEFARLWKLLISQYEIASIPVALDRVGLGELPRQRRRDLKCLLVLGASDDVLPKTGGGGLLSDPERESLLSRGLRLPGGTEERLYRELGAVYSTLTLPSDKLIVSWHAAGGKRASFVVRRLSELLGLDERTDGAPDFRENARRPCFELAASYVTRGGNGKAAAAAAYFARDASEGERLRRIGRAAGLGRGRLADSRASTLYGRELVLSASRVDTFYACRYMYFLQYGLGARPRRAAGFDAPTAGTFMHYVLENVTRELRKSGGVSGADDDACRALTEKYAGQYAETVLQSFQDKSGRFIYLFNRMKNDAVHIVRDMVGELKNSDFVPLDFALAFSDGGDIPPRRVEGPDARLTVRGFVDRLDGWEHDGRLYLRVVDYKTGRKKFSLSDVLHGMNMQMLIYLFALRENGGARYGKEIVPAGVLYAPAREEPLGVPRSLSDEELEMERAKKRRRSGLLLGDAAVLEQWSAVRTRSICPSKQARTACRPATRWPAPRSSRRCPVTSTKCW